ncbi:hypothetical protein [Amycolatopsis suaedae]|uniref:DUF1772 domain-containing protein n=1 Tax=Amycolatopsis suaedae TaxID=2510978 RepID=A0A4Q7JE83_9PSEU|nr:hypothetical protein [Amycolatopsis suaedae]RZQ64704.1 hypothetical protein EWH70_07375 [Amycolatopsis suaedae]
MTVVRHTGALLFFLAWWGFGNLYEAIVVMPWLSGLPPGSLVDEFTIGSPVLYFLPIGPLVLILAWTLVPRSRARQATVAATLLTLAMAVSALPILVFNPVLRDPAVSTADVSSAVLNWELVNAVRLLLVAAAAAVLVRLRARLVPPS